MNRYVYGDPKARRVVLECIVAVVAAGALLKLYARFLPQPAGAPALVLQTFADRALLASTIATVLYLLVAWVIVWLAFRAARSKQWPPAGMRMPFRTKIHPLPNTTMVWLAVGLLLCLKGYVVVLYWQQYQYMQSLADIVAK